MDLSRLSTPKVDSADSCYNAANFPRIEYSPTDSAPADSIDALMATLQAFARDHGFAIVRRNSSKYVNGEATYDTLRCDRDAVRQTQGVGLRPSKTQKVGCP
ncbi:uncharacterized protein BDZ83DRAFT_757090 [Colletotrichum acutatum]|uniref:Uncharacterized protein n=1 Tax=Glomerella acutata TaxID=27357 RepID=A0AAD8U8C0_GLOAC|nr:uncharacterized protein BDZ83DRAFT_757090 [Colletotrichum acutatum]KAK1712219.1 hypothetical protein BDZ83DRAFT_757090 [Colletotrichum acutatum]